MCIGFFEPKTQKYVWNTGLIVPKNYSTREKIDFFMLDIALVQRNLNSAWKYQLLSLSARYRMKISQDKKPIDLGRACKKDWLRN